MTISIAPGLGLTVIGPGLPVQISSTVPPPYPPGTTWTFGISLQPSSIDPVVTYVGPATTSTAALYVYVPPSGWTEHFGAWTPANTQAIYLNGVLGTTSVTLDTGSATSTWDALSGLGFLSKVLAGSGSSSVHTIDDVWNSVNRIFGP